MDEIPLKENHSGIGGLDVLAAMQLFEGHVR